MVISRTWIRVCSAIATVSLGATPAYCADNYPSKPVRLILPFGAGGSTDIVGRIFAQRVSDVWGQSLVIDNRAGAGGTGPNGRPGVGRPFVKGVPDVCDAGQFPGFCARIRIVPIICASLGSCVAPTGNPLVWKMKASISATCLPLRVPGSLTGMVS